MGSSRVLLVSEEETLCSVVPHRTFQGFATDTESLRTVFFVLKGNLHSVKVLRLYLGGNP